MSASGIAMARPLDATKSRYDFGVDTLARAAQLVVSVRAFGLQS